MHPKLLQWILLEENPIWKVDKKRVDQYLKVNQSFENTGVFKGWVHNNTKFLLNLDVFVF